MSAQPGSVLLVLLLATSTPIASASKPSVDAARYSTSRPSVEAARSGTSRSSGKSGESGQSGGDAELTALRSGRYEEVIGGYRAALGSARGAEVTEAARRLVDALLLVGRYEEAERSAREYASGNPERAAQIANRLGEALSHVGRLAEAQAAFETSISAGAGDALRAELNLAELRFARGDHDEAMRGFDRFIAVYNAARSSRSGLSAEDLTAVGVACVYLGRENPDLFHDVVRAFDQAIAADPGDPEPRLRMAELFLDKYDSREAGSLLRDVLAANGLHPRALLARARQARFDGEGDALAWVDKALAVNERLVPARVHRARSLLSNEQFGAAEKEAHAALEVNPSSLEALSILAAAQFLSRDTAAFESTVARVLSLNPRYAPLFDELADMAVQNRFYAEAVEFAGRGAEIDPSSWNSLGTLGINELRVGQIEQGRRHLEAAFAGDPFNVWIKNTLDLLDTYESFVIRSGRLANMFIERREADILALYGTPLADEAVETLSARYGFTPSQKVRLEVYSSHADFSVRTVGLAGLGALGVSFGNVIALGSPSARPAGEFNWGSTLWHEVTHTITLGATEHRIPRWFTEGLSVYEERRALPGWGGDVSPGFLMAKLQDKLLPVSRLGDSFVRPSYPGQVGHAYYQASLVCELIERDFGFAGIRRLLDAYRGGIRDPDAFEDALGIDADELEARFQRYIESRFGHALEALRPSLGEQPESSPEAVREMIAGGGAPEAETLEELRERAESSPGDFQAQLRWGAHLRAAGDLQTAVGFLERAKQLFPEYAGGDSPYWFLARIHEELGDKQRAELRADVGDANGEVVERRTVLALNPVDRAEAHYRLAIAHERAGDAARARRQVLMSLEIAPGYPDAQELLLRLVQGTAASASTGEGS